MIIKTLTNDDWEIFCALAAAESWQISFKEQFLFLNQWRPYFYVLWDHGERCGFMSAVMYKNSGWIGNLLIDQHQRGHGYGAKLLDFAIDHFQKSNLARIWLTASAQGAPLYRKRHFKTVDQIVRWCGQGTGEQTEYTPGDLAELTEADTKCWHESRRPLINALADDGIIIKAGASLALLQTGRASWQIGPWVSNGLRCEDAQELLDHATKLTPQGKTLMVDIVKSADLDFPLRQAGFSGTGQNELMCLSTEEIKLSGVCALASLGSIG
jgi:GNAT superfamily N-acetyltransferase